MTRPWHELTAHELRDALRNGETTSVEVTRRSSGDADS